MNLAQTTQNALDYTRRLEAALNLEDYKLSEEILEIRGQAMEAFEMAHLQASSQEKKACHQEILDLARADQKLQEMTAASLDTIAGEFRKSMSSNQAGAQNSYGANPANSCVDRKA